MRKYFAILGVLILLIPLVFGGTFQVPIASAQDGKTSTKISSLLGLQVETKRRASEVAPLEEGRVDILQAMQATGAEVAPLNKQQIFIHFAQKPSQSEIQELEAMGLTPYLDSWIPPLENHPTGFIVADMPIDKLEALAGKDYVVRLETAEQFLEPHNDLATQKINADDVWSAGYNGTGVTIAVIDSGLDVTHNDIPAPTASKDYSSYPTLGDNITNPVIGHGTHVTGSALGRGTQSSGTYNGTAPGADLVFLKIGDNTTGSASIAAEVAALRAAVDTYNADIITLSYGGWGSYHDGTRENSQAVDYAVSQGAVVFCSAGNEANDDEHYSGTVSASSNTSYIQVNVSGSNGSNSYLYFNLVWYDGIGTNNDLELEYYDSSKNPIANWYYTQSESSRGTESEYSAYGPSVGFVYWLPAGSPTYYLKVKNNSASSQFFHIYEHGAGSVKFASPDPDYTISSPADADSAIAVGAYTTRTSWTDYTGAGGPNWGQTLDTIASFSSRGPRVDTGAPSKPNFVAPGSAIISVRDTDIYTWPSGYDGYIIDNDGLNLNGPGPADYFVMQGTSMACPLTAGVAALLLEKNPTWTPAQVKLALENTATDKGATGYDNTYGWGLIDALAALSYDFVPPTMEAIAESQGLYYNTAPVFSNFGFDDDVALDDGWYQMDSHTGSWIVLFTDATGTSSDNDSWPIPNFGDLAEGSRTIYFKASDDTGNVEGESGEWSWQFYKDTTPPTDPTSANSTSHSLSTWSSDNTVDIGWIDATDATSLLDGYSILWNTDNATATPDTNKNIEEGVESANSTALADGNSHYFHIRSVDNVGNWQSTVHVGPFYIETVPPTDPTSVNSTSHTTSVWSSDNTVDIGWIDATDATSLLDGYSVLWDTTASTIPNQTLDIEEEVQSANSTALSDDNSHYFHIRSVDNAGNWQSTVHVGPFFIDANPPSDPTSVNSTSHTVSAWSSDNTVDIGWIDATDSGSGLDGYSILWNTDNATAIPDTNKNIDEGVESANSTALADGNSHYFHIRSVDNFGNWQSTVHYGPFYIAVNCPILSEGTVNPTSGYTSASFTYSVNYTDFENDAPSSTTISINGGASENMTARDSQDVDFTDGKIYEYTTTGASLGIGTHTFQFDASDGTDNAIGDTGSHSGPTVSSPGGGGGGDGGGGGGGGATEDARFTSLRDAIKESGELFDDIVALSLDNKLRLDIPTGTFAKNRNNVFLNSMRVTTLAEPPEVSENMEMIGLAYELGPAGATFDPPIDMTIKYDVSLIPEGIAEKNLIVAWWDETASNWVDMESTVDPETDTITAKIDHFSIYTVMARTRPASFTIADLSVTPGEVNLGESVSISVFITNIGDLTGSYEISLKIGDVVLETKEITLSGGDSETVSFSATPDTAGRHKVNVSGLIGTCEVKAPPPAPAPVPAVAPAPPSFATSDLSVAPIEVKLAEQVTISAVVTNIGGSEGSYTVVLKINGAEETKKEVTLGAGKSETVTFIISKDTEGSYTVNIDGNLGQFTVIVPPPPTPTPTEALPVQPPTNWWLIGSIIAGCIVAAGLLVYFFVWRKRGAAQPS